MKLYTVVHFLVVFLFLISLKTRWKTFYKHPPSFVAVLYFMNGFVMFVWMQEVVDVDFRPKLACVFILKLYDAQWSQLLHLKNCADSPWKMWVETGSNGILLSVMRNLKPLGFYPMSLAVFAPMLWGNSNVLAVITCGIKDWPLENTHQAAKQRIQFIHCPVLIHNWSLQGSVFQSWMCVGSLLEVLQKLAKIILDFMLQPKLRHPCAQYPNQIISKSHRGHIKDLAFSAEQDFLFFWTYKPGYTNKENNSEICSGTTPVLFWSSRWWTPAQSAPRSDPSRVSSAGLKHNYQGRFVLVGLPVVCGQSFFQISTI